MPTYGENEFKESNVNYLNKDFASLKESLMNYAESYFPNTYRDFNEASPGMMLLEMNAYVGDVLSFYIDQQYREMLLPLAEERRNVVTMAKMFGYKVKPIVPSYVELRFTSNVNASSGDVSKVDYSNAGIFDAGIQIPSITNASTIFTTLEPIDFKITGSNDTEIIASSTDSGLASTYTLGRNVKAVSATQKTITFQVGAPQKFKTLTIPDTDVVDIVSCVDSNGNNWYEVDFLAQDKVPIPTHYTEDSNRSSAYVDTNGLISSTAVPFSLQYISTPKRFTRETNLDNTTSLVFGNGILKNGQLVDEGFIDMEQIGIVIPGQTSDLNSSIDPLLGNEYSTLGETPNNITLTITYRVGGGIKSNVPSADLTNLPTSLTAQNGNTSATLVSVTNLNPAVGGKDEESIIEIKEKTKAFFTTQNRCVTKEDYEARVLNIPAKFGNIAKAYVARLGGINEYEGDSLDYVNSWITAASILHNQLLIGEEGTPAIQQFVNENPTPTQSQITSAVEIGTINIYALCYNNAKQLVGNPHANSLDATDNLPSTLLQNIKKYLENFRLMTDVVTINDGYIVNFGVFFDVIAEKYANKQEVKLNCIQRIKDYFQIDKMQFNQPIFKSKLEFELMGIEGIRSVGHVTITQEYDYFYSDIAGNPTGEGDSLSTPTYTYSYDNSGNFETSQGVGYGYKYDFVKALSDDKTIVIPPISSTPTVFELKNPNTNIQGRVR